MHLHLSSIITLVVLTPLAAEDGCGCRFKGMRGTVNLYKLYKANRNRFIHALRPYQENFEVNYQLEKAWFYPSAWQLRSTFKYNIYLQDLKTNTMYIYPHNKTGPTGTCRSVTMPKELIVPSCLPADSKNSSRGEKMEIFSLNEKQKFVRYHYLVDANDPCKVYRVAEYHERTDSYFIALGLRVLETGLDFTNKTPRFKLDTDNCQEEDIDNLFSE